ncbi:hypothetical protein BKA66DRAFT_433229 [Pyrenochaeta sp. MPI-SDFR-AT-0127]|nr:hypothetical protein BKA66DRAFT_433229 [Pyrenochaeta sp. MPI-SDFR-AT-0127]
MRQCIELGLHIKPLKRLEPLLEQHHRRIFWECYVLDRYSSGILGRPFAICEKDITVLLPINAYDHSIAATGAVELDSIPENQVEVLTDVTIFISIGHVFAAFSRFRTQLDLWRSTVPVFSSPRSLYERSDWHDFMYYKDMLLLTRGAMQSLPSLSTSASSITTDVLVACYTSARRVIQLYADLMDQRAITWTRSYFQVIFTAGLTVIYSISLEVLKRDGCEMHSQHDAIETLARCSEILNHFREHMPDAGSFTIVFDLLKDECIADKLDDTNSALGFNQRSEGFPGSIGTHMGFTLQDVNISNENVQHIDTGVNDVGLAVYDLGFGLTDNFITQLEVGLGEYAWGSAPADGSFWDQLFF